MLRLGFLEKFVLIKKITSSTPKSDSAIVCTFAPERTIYFRDAPGEGFLAVAQRRCRMPLHNGVLAVRVDIPEK